MSTRVVDRVEDWDSRSFDGGFGELHTLADEGFSGVVRAGTAELYMTRGSCVGVRQGSIDEFEGASGTLYKAPSDPLPLLAIMQEEADEVHAKYYSEKTSIAEVDRTLSDGGFTGYIELSENVLSGDYYLVYHAGESMSAAYVGESQQLLDGDEAFERADDEVGIFQVYKVDVDIVEIPEPSEPAPRTGGVGAGDGADPLADDDTPDGDDAEAGTGDGQTGTEGGSAPAAAAGATESAKTENDQAATEHATPETSSGQSDGATGTKAESEQSTGQQESDQTVDQRASGQPAEQPQDGDTGEAETRTETKRLPEETGTTEAEADPVGGAADSTTAADTGSRRPARTEERRETEQTEPAGRPTEGHAVGTETEQQRPETAGTGAATGTAQQSGPARGARNLEKRAIPSLDPERTVEPEEPNQPTTKAHSGSTGGKAAKPQPQATSEPEREAKTEEATSEPAPDVDPERLEELETQLSERETEIDRLEDELDGVRAERDDLEEQLTELREERDELRGEVEQLRSELEHLETELGAATDAERRMSAGEALAGTDLFVRYHSKGDATLEKAHSSSVRKENVNENLRLETHTTFEDANVAVGGQSFDEFLESTAQYQFVQWVVRELLFEIRSTGHEKGLQDLYNALPSVDRAELSGVVEVTYTEDGQETRTEEAFDVILRDRMGNPLLAANINDSRQAATESMMENLITSAERVGQSAAEFAAAFMVTQSFFEPGALETTSAATQGGILSRDKRKSFVNLSRKRGYHLCLVEARNDNFHLTVPEL